MSAESVVDGVAENVVFTEAHLFVGGWTDNQA